eukprot:NODE_316_length_9983_cov_1.089741.p9 type:complete len:168 gc:universal NODE_316_length_9983_cov_1.089741:535-1038(+)
MLPILALFYGLKITIIQPYAGTEYKTGDNIQVSWSVDGEVPESVSFVLLDGRSNMNNADNLGEVTTVSPQVQGFTFKASESLSTGSKYFLRVGNDGEYRYSSAFKIQASKDSKNNTKDATDNSKDSSNSTKTDSTDSPAPAAAAEGSGSNVHSIILSLFILLIMFIL